MVVHSKILKKHFDNLGFDDKFFDTYELAAIDKMQNIDTMCEMLYSIQQLQSKMVICTDFDVDGIMSSIIVILSIFLDRFYSNKVKASRIRLG